MTAQGNFEGHNILNRLDSRELRDAETEARLAAMRAKLLERRASRVRPGFDDKVLADWNGLMIAALANAADTFERADWLAAAERAFDFICTRMTSNGRLLHAYRNGEAKAPATASDYANMIKAALALANVTGKPDYIERAKAWAEVLDTHYWSENLGGYYFTADDTVRSDRAAVQRPGRGDAERQRHHGVEPGGALSVDRRGALSRARRRHPARLRRGDGRQRAGACRAARGLARCDGAGACRADRARGEEHARAAPRAQRMCRCRTPWCRR